MSFLLFFSLFSSDDIDTELRAEIGYSSESDDMTDDILTHSITEMNGDIEQFKLVQSIRSENLNTETPETPPPQQVNSP